MADRSDLKAYPLYIVLVISMSLRALWYSLILYPQKGQRGSPRFLESLNSEALKADIERPLLKQPINSKEEVICHKIYAFVQLAKTTLHPLLRVQIKFD